MTEIKEMQIDLQLWFVILTLCTEKLIDKKIFLIIKDIDLKDTFNHFDLIDIYKTPHPIATGYPFLAGTHKTFTKVRGRGGEG